MYLATAAPSPVGNTTSCGFDFDSNGLTSENAQVWILSVDKGDMKPDSAGRLNASAMKKEDFWNFGPFHLAWPDLNAPASTIR